MINKKKTKKNKYLKYKLNLLVDKYRNYEDKSFFHILLNLHDYNKNEQKAIKIVAEERQEKIIYLEEYYKNKYNTKSNIELGKKLLDLREKGKLTVQLAPHLIVLNKYQKKGNENVADKSKNRTFIYYPDLLDPYFNKKIMGKKEFSDNIETDSKENISEDDKFSLTPSQTFIKHFISPETPYNSILLFHGTGVGKTCTAISIAEQFLSYIKNSSISRKKNRILILASPNVQENFRNEIINIDKFISNKGKIDGCTGDKYAKKISSFLENKVDDYKKSINSLIDENYEFKGYQKFANEVENIENEAIKNLSEYDTAKIEEIKAKKRKEYFSNTVLIIDEAHSIKTDKSNKDSKKVPIILENVIRDAENLKLVLLTATPMLDSCREIVFLLNLLLINDNRPELDENDIFDMNDNLKEEGRKLLIKKSSGYISYIRGQNQNFPYRLYPDINNNPNVLKISKLPKYEHTNVLIPEKNRIKHLTLVSSIMDNYQYETYNLCLNIDNSKSNFSNEFQSSLMALNIVFPEKKIQKEGIEKCFTKSKGYKYSYNPDIIKKYGHFLKYDLIGKYSCKFKNIFESIVNSRGIIFIYSNFISGGILPFSLFLEQNGFVKYGHNKEYNNIFDEPRDYISFDGKPRKDFKNINDFRQASYITIIGNENVSIKNDIDKINIVNGENNKYGEEIKVVLASKAGGEGIDLHRIREVHILEPWFNLNKIEQAIGRGIRNKSHEDLPVEERNVTVYQHVALNPENSEDSHRETTDLKMYRIAENKQLNIAKVEYELKRNAINCFFNKKINMLTNDNIITVKTSQNKIKKYNTVDKPYTNICNYRPECTYKCFQEVDMNNLNINDDTYGRSFAEKDIEEIKIIIKKMFLKKNIYNLNEIMTIINDHKPYKNISEKIKFIAINEILDNKETIIDKFGRNGTMVYKNLYYIFKDEYSEEKLIIHESRYPRTKKNLNFLLFNNSEKYKESKKKYKKDVKQIIDEVKSEIEKLDKKYFLGNKLWLDKEKDIIQELSVEYCVDNLFYEEKKELIQELINNYELWITEPEMLLFYKCFEYNIAYKNNYPCGFILRNNNSILEYFKYSKNDKFFYSDINYKWFKDKDLKKKKDLKRSSIFGFTYMDHRNIFLFKFITDVKLSDTQGVGKVCNHHEKPIIEKTVSRLLNLDIKKYRDINSSNPNIKKRKKNIVCLELEMLLRYNDKMEINNLSWFQRFLY